MGKAAKEHRKKVQARNARIKSEKNMVQKLFNESMKQQIEEHKRKQEEMSGQTITQE